MHPFDSANSAVCDAAELMPIMVAVVDRDLRYLYVNRLYASYFGLTPAEFDGKAVGDIVRLADDFYTDEARFRAVRHCIDSGGEVEMIARVHRHEGDMRKLLTTLVGDSRLGVCYAYVNDVTAPDAASELLECELVRRLAGPCPAASSAGSL